jgi:hypothetical protein
MENKKCIKMFQTTNQMNSPIFFRFRKGFTNISPFHQGADQGDALHEEDAADPSFDAFPDGTQLGQAQHAH